MLVLGNLSYCVAYGAALVLLMGIGLYALARRRSTPGALPLLVMCLAQGQWVLGHLFGPADVPLEGNLFRNYLQFISGPLWAAALLILALEYTGRRLASPRLIWGVTGVLIAGLLLMAYTNTPYSLTRTMPAPASAGAFAPPYDFGTVAWVLNIYFLALAILATGVLAANLFPSTSVRRAQTLILLGGGILAVLSTAINNQGNLVPLIGVLSSAIIAAGLFGFGRPDMTPMALAAIIQSIDDIVIVLDTEDRLIDLNPAARRVIAPECSQVIGSPISALFPNWAWLVEKYRDVYTAREEIAFDQDETCSYFDFRLTPLHDHHGVLLGRLIMVRDITAERRAEKLLRERTAQLETANRELEVANEQLHLMGQAKDDFVSNVAHELRTPITSLKLNLHLLARRPEKWEQYLPIVRRETDRLASIIDDLLRLSRLDQGRVEFEFGPVNLNALANQYVEDRKVVAEGRGITLRFEGDPRLLPIEADGGLLGQVLSILLTNALNYTPAGGSVTVSTAFIPGKQAQAVLRVSDTGPGISAEEQAQLFRRFFRGAAGRASGMPGTGLGLALAWEIVQRHRGHITVESEGIPGRGTTFSVFLPA